MCHEGECICKPNYELFQKQCIPTQGCLLDGHCIEQHTECMHSKCTCKVNYSWDPTAGVCVPVQKTLTDRPTVVSTTDETTSMISTRVMTTNMISTNVMTTIPEVTSTEGVISTSTGKTMVTSTEGRRVSTTGGRVASTTGGRVASTTGGRVASTTGGRVASTTGGRVASTSEGRIASTSEGRIASTIEGRITSTTENAVKEAIKDESIPQEFWKWIGIGGGALVFFLVLAIGFYCYTKQCGKSLMYNKKNNGPNIEPCGTPHLIKRSDENEFFIWHFWFLFVR
ncbi:Hypothetical predicted protein [Paramuricea clavata]|uniref:Uncharacterized protein n=2 Tax=Paramuricea clavata TaxID=317549 RepID=A0A7D9DLK2_PARCT|nr:Hypothetical predicted protein [Paramuricea clavata]